MKSLSTARKSFKYSGNCKKGPAWQGLDENADMSAY
jgi:hypothetical protein